ncbi:MAG TPA: HEAT repeat domain-containing protein [Candidatus Saccharimonadales bacterium]|nr:HEAT repeat domain-containing protein [Candidatus Saccharimonadales bacterium]
MRRWQLAFRISFLFVVGGLAACFVSSSAEPSYKGHRLSYWLEANTYKAGVSRHEAQEALRHIGTNALPFLLRDLAAQPGRWEMRVTGLKRMIGLGTEDKSRARAAHAALAFETLGERAAPSIADLNAMLYSPTNLDRYFPAAALAGIGAPALPVFLAALTNRNPNVQVAVIQAFGALGTNGSIAAPVLIQTLSDQDWGVRQAAASLLGLSGIDPRVVVPALINTLADSNRFVRSMAGYSLINLGQKAVPYLNQALESDNRFVRSGASNALTGIPTEFKHDLEAP